MQLTTVNIVMGELLPYILKYSHVLIYVSTENSQYPIAAKDYICKRLHRTFSLTYMLITYFY